jgi:hypothetical protein
MTISRTSLSFALKRLVIVLRRTVKILPFFVLLHMCVNPRKSNVAGFPSPRSARFASAKRPNSMRRVFSL